MKKEITFKDLIERVNLEGIGEDKEKGESSYSLFSKLKSKLREILTEYGFDEITITDYKECIIIKTNFTILDKNIKADWKAIKIKVRKKKLDKVWGFNGYATFYNFEKLIFSEDNWCITEDEKIVNFIEMVRQDERQKQLEKDKRVELLLNKIEDNKINLKEFLDLVNDYNKLDYMSKKGLENRIIEKRN